MAKKINCASDVLLGMDFLIRHHAHIDLAENRLILQVPMDYEAIDAGKLKFIGNTKQSQYDCPTNSKHSRNYQIRMNKTEEALTLKPRSVSSRTITVPSDDTYIIHRGEITPGVYVNECITDALNKKIIIPINTRNETVCVYPKEIELQVKQTEKTHVRNTNFLPINTEGRVEYYCSAEQGREMENICLEYNDIFYVDNLRFGGVHFDSPFRKEFVDGLKPFLEARSNTTCLIRVCKYRCVICVYCQLAFVWPRDVCNEQRIQ